MSRSEVSLMFFFWSLLRDSFVRVRHTSFIPRRFHLNERKILSHFAASKSIIL